MIVPNVSWRKVHELKTISLSLIHKRKSPTVDSLKRRETVGFLNAAVMENKSNSCPLRMLWLRFTSKKCFGSLTEARGP